jgi:hypothetical protein
VILVEVLGGAAEKLSWSRRLCASVKPSVYHGIVMVRQHLPAQARVFSRTA